MNEHKCERHKTHTRPCRHTRQDKTRQDKTRQDKTVAPVVQDSLKILRDTQKHLIVTANTVSPKQSNQREPKGTSTGMTDSIERTN